MLKPRFCESHCQFTILKPKIDRCLDVVGCLCSFHCATTMHTVSSNIFFDATRFYQSSELVPLKAMAHAIWGHTKNRISLCKPPSPVGADEQNLERSASQSSKHNCSLLTFALRYHELTGIIQQVIATKTWKPSCSGSMLIFMWNLFVVFFWAWSRKDC